MSDDPQADPPFDEEEGLMSLEEAVDALRPDQELLALRKENKRLHKEMMKTEEAYGDLKSFFSELKNELRPITLPSQKLLRTAVAGPKSKVLSPVSCVCQWSDWHMGACQQSDEIEGLEAFNPDILESRILEELIPSVLKWVKVHRAAYKVPVLRILDHGDNISGDIHPELQITNAFPVPAQIIRAAELKARAIAALAPHFEEVVVDWLTVDNHGRLTRKPQAKQEGLNNHNYTVGYITKLLLKDQPNVTFNMHCLNRRVIEVQGRRYLVMHGHDIRGWAGVPWYGVERMAGKEAKNRLNDPIARRFHKMVIGHFHTPFANDWYMANGSPQGTDAYDHKNGRRSDPTQCAWFVHPRHGEFDWTPFHLGSLLEGERYSLDVTDPMEL